MTRIGLAAAIAALALLVYGWNQQPPEDFALRKDDSHIHENADGLPLTTASVASMPQVLDANVKSARPTIVWLGNSQLHTINQFKKGQHIAPYWLWQKLEKKVAPLGFSLPNANFQELYALAAMAMQSAKPRMIIIGLVFDDLREDGLRGDFASLDGVRLQRTMEGSAVGRQILARFAAERAQGSEGKDNDGLAGFGQQHIETKLNAFLTSHFPLWAKRPNLRSALLTDLYYLRNWVFGIKPTTVRMLIPIRYQRNMQALQQLLEDARVRSIPVLAYVAPIRPGVEPPYDAKQYGEWKAVVSKLVATHSGRLVNLENLVPEDKWGTYHGDDVDFMHFQHEGHRMLADELLPHVTEMTGSR